MFKNYKYLHVEGYLVLNQDLIETAFKIAKRNGLITCIDLASFNVVEDNLEFLTKLVNDYVDIVFANEEEARITSYNVCYTKLLRLKFFLIHLMQALR